MREWRQFRLLWRDALRKLLNAAVMGRDIDPVQLAIWMTAMVMVPPSLYGFGQLFKYGVMRFQPANVVEGVVLHDRMFFVFYSMVAAALLASFTWEALFPDRTDQEVVGVLPVRPRTLAAARLAAGMTAAAGFCVAVNAPSALFFALASVSAASVGFLPLVFLGHLLGTMAGCLFIFTALLAVRGMVAVIAGADIADRLATLLQLTAIVCLFEVFFYLPSVIPFLVEQTLLASSAVRWLPPVWFVSLYSVIAGTARDTLIMQGAWGAAALAGVVLLVIPIYLLPARVMARRALESQSRERPGLLSGLVRHAAGRLAPNPASRAVAEFTITSLWRNRRHVLIVVSYAGVGLAIAAIAVISARIRVGLISPEPTTAILAVPLVMMFFVALGLRAAFRIPTDLDANWAFRATPPTTEEAGTGAKVALFVLAVAPITALMALFAITSGWPAGTVLAVALFDLVTGLLLLDAMLLGWVMVPFACAYAPSQESMKARWLIYLVPLNIFAFRTAGFQANAIDSLRGVITYVAVTGALALVMRQVRLRRSRREPLTFDHPGGQQVEVLNLSEAL